MHYKIISSQSEYNEVKEGILSSNDPVDTISTDSPQELLQNLIDLVEKMETNTDDILTIVNNRLFDPNLRFVFRGRIVEVLSSTDRPDGSTTLLNHFICYERTIKLHPIIKVLLKSAELGAIDHTSRYVGNETVNNPLLNSIFSANKTLEAYLVFKPKVLYQKQILLTLDLISAIGALPPSERSPIFQFTDSFKEGKRCALYAAFASFQPDVVLALIRAGAPINEPLTYWKDTSPIIIQEKFNEITGKTENLPPFTPLPIHLACIIYSLHPDKEKCALIIETLINKMDSIPPFYDITLGETTIEVRCYNPEYFLDFCGDVKKTIYLGPSETNFSTVTSDGDFSPGFFDFQSFFLMEFLNPIKDIYNKLSILKTDADDQTRKLKDLFQKKAKTTSVMSGFFAQPP